MVQSSFEYSPSNKHYAFGGGRKTYSLGKVKLPVYVIDENMQPHLLQVCIEILNQKNLPLLLGNRSLIKTKSTIKFGDHTLTIDWKNEKLCLPISLESSGHFYLQFYPMSQVEENRLTNDFVQQANWTKEETRKVVAYVAMEKKPKMEKIKEPGKLSTLTNWYLKVPCARKNISTTKAQICMKFET